ncbi:MAG: phage tail assembly chaperone [Alphaproteobacteria bacterium]|nr:phage tail assembly chaperone [Alphaproteobacteria bacterium]
METQKFPWDDLTRAALMMGIGFEQFWTSTPGEILRVLSPPHTSTTNIRPLNRAGLERLMAQFPDRVEKENK